MRNQVGTRLEPGARVACALDPQVRPVRNQVGTRLEPGIRLAVVALSQPYPIAPVDLFKILNKQRAPGAGRGGAVPFAF